MRFYISDLHFFHRNINNRMDKRGFPDVESMNECMIERWNSRVRRKDEVVILGDLSFGKAKETNEIVKRLNGRKMLILGNHDKWAKETEADLSQFVWVKDYAEMNDEKRRVILFHYPIACYNGQFRRNDKGVAKTWMLHGHIHNTADNVMLEEYKKMVRGYLREVDSGKVEYAPCQMINCFCMRSGYVPLTLDEWIKEEENRRTEE